MLVLKLGASWREELESLDFIEDGRARQFEALEGLLQLPAALVVAVEVHNIRRHPTGPSHRHLSAGYHVRSQSLLHQQAGQRQVGKRL